MSVNLSAIASALAARFDATAVTAPTGYDNIALSTHLLPTAIVSTPTVLVFPPEAGFQFWSSASQSGDLEFPVRVYIGQESDRPQVMQRVYAWYDALLAQPLGDTDLGRSEVSHIFTTGSRFGELTYAEQTYLGIEFAVNVHIVDAINPVP